MAIEFGELAGLLEKEGLDLTITGFETAEIDALLGDPGAPGEEPEDTLPEQGPPAVVPGDLWILGKHRLICADARDPAALAHLMGGQKARMVFVDPPYNVPIAGHVKGARQDPAPGVRLRLRRDVRCRLHLLSAGGPAPVR